MNRQILSASRLVSFQDIRRNWVKHEDRLIHIKPTIDSRNPFTHSPRGKKCNYAKSLEIQLENKALLKKLTDRTECRNDVSLCTTLSMPKSNRKKYYDDYKLRQQNQGLYRRLKEAKPVIDRSKFKQDRKQTEKYINSISKFGWRGLRPNKTYLKFQMRNNDLKYLSRRKIIMNSTASDDPGISSRRESPTARLERQNQKIKNNNRLFFQFSRYRLIEIDGQEVQLKIEETSRCMILELRAMGDKQNEKPIELQVKIERAIFDKKFKGDLEYLISKLRFNARQQVFFIV